MQSMPGVAAPDHDHALAGGGDLGPGLGRPGRPALLRGYPAVALVEVIHREVDPAQLAPGASRSRDTREPIVTTSASWRSLELGGVDIAPDIGVVDELDPLLREDLDAAIDDRLLELRVRNAEAHQTAGALVALVDGHVVPAAVELVGDREPGGPGADHGDRLVGSPRRRFGNDPALRRTRARRSPSRSARSLPDRR